MHNQHAGLSHVLAEQRITERRQQAAHARLADAAHPPGRRRRSRGPRWLGAADRWPGVATVQIELPFNIGQTAAMRPTTPPFDRAKPTQSLEAEPTMATNRFTRQLAAILRETADMGAQSWRDQVSEAGWVPRPELAAPCSCCHRRALERIASSAADGGAAVRFCSDCDRLGAPMVTSG